ncbi:fluoride efflux transporter CrcB [Calderihabitans maritimus]|uniref:Fluoride-specific ion channel FluC n=1 Tax=Calderihabitans maritimus TaxID=1246530 RepID=A0A1Z5HR00_9FIRM|nr:fluoride efflux transporter CrcB [Calderihabitans maritimus]GAW91858.1 chromosome condensation protein CrcB [Calderihabitans maritimus]
MLTYFFVALGGALGAVFRFSLSSWIFNRMGDHFPYGTFAVNIIGCFLLGLFYSLSIEKSVISANVRTLVAVGMLGAFTTFSTFSNESLVLIQEGQIQKGMLYIVASVLMGLLAVWLGHVTSKLF